MLEALTGSQSHPQCRASSDWGTSAVLSKARNVERHNPTLNAGLVPTGAEGSLSLKYRPSQSHPQCRASSDLRMGGGTLGVIDSGSQSHPQCRASSDAGGRSRSTARASHGSQSHPQCRASSDSLAGRTWSAGRPESQSHPQCRASSDNLCACWVGTRGM